MTPKHVPESREREIMLEAERAREAAVADELNQERIDVARTLESFAKRVEAMISKAEQEDNPGLALAAAERLRKVLRDIAQLQRKMANNLTVQVTLMESTAWLELREILELLFERHPAAKDDFLCLSRQKRLSIAPEAGRA